LTGEERTTKVIETENKALQNQTELWNPSSELVAAEVCNPCTALSPFTSSELIQVTFTTAGEKDRCSPLCSSEVQWYKILYYT
jgi:hypothetical protein